MAGDARKEIKISEGIIIITGDDDGREMHGGRTARQPRDRVTAVTNSGMREAPLRDRN